MFNSSFVSGDQSTTWTRALRPIRPFGNSRALPVGQVSFFRKNPLCNQGTRSNAEKIEVKRLAPRKAMRVFLISIVSNYRRYFKTELFHHTDHFKVPFVLRSYYYVRSITFVLLSSYYEHRSKRGKALICISLINRFLSDAHVVRWRPSWSGF